MGCLLLKTEEEIIVPQMVGFEILTKIIIAYLKVGGDKQEKGTSVIANVANVARANVSLNSKFLRSIGIIEGSRGKHKLTTDGAQYAQALDWGRLTEANKFLRKLLKDRPVTKRTLGYVDINRPVDKETLVGQIAIIAGVRREPRYVTGIRGFVDMLVTSSLLQEDKERRLVSGIIPEKQELPVVVEEKGREATYQFPAIQPSEATQRVVFPITLNFTISDETSVENLKKILQAIKEVFSEE